tara:strand:- start:830 stop:1612 length:783 start_codon:yes stop_codon:yes gene_type:complete
MIDLSFIDQIKAFTSSKDRFPIGNISQKNFNSILLKHQINMLEAWNIKKSDSLTGISSGQLTEFFLKFRDIQKSSMLKPPLDPQKVLKSYQNEKIKETNSSTFNKDSLVELANRIAKKNNVPKFFFQKLIQAESSFDPKAKSSRGAMGLGQLMPATAKELGLSLKEGESIGSVWNPESNLDASARYLRKLFDKYVRKQGIPENEAWNFAAGAYNAGMGNIGRAMDKLGEVKEWDQVAAVLPQITGKYSAETINYVNRLRA